MAKVAWARDVGMVPALYLGFGSPCGMGRVNLKPQEYVTLSCLGDVEKLLQENRIPAKGWQGPRVVALVCSCGVLPGSAERYGFSGLERTLHAA